MSKNNLLFLATLFIITLFRAYILGKSSLTFFSDDAIYASLARFWASGELQKVFHPTWPPLFPFFGALLYSLRPNWEDALRLVSVLSSILVLVPIFILVKKTLSFVHGLFFAISIAIFPQMIYVSNLAHSDSLATLFIISSLVSTFFAIHIRRYKLFILGAFFAGLTYLTRAEGMMFFSLSATYITIYLLFHALFKKTSPRTLFYIPLFALTFFLTISPYAIATKNQLGNFGLSAKFSAQIQQGHAFQIRKNGTT